MTIQQGYEHVPTTKCMFMMPPNCSQAGGRWIKNGDCWESNRVTNGQYRDIFLCSCPVVRCMGVRYCFLWITPPFWVCIIWTFLMAVVVVANIMLLLKLSEQENVNDCWCMFSQISKLPCLMFLICVCTSNVAICNEFIVIFLRFSRNFLTASLNMAHLSRYWAHAHNCGEMVSKYAQSQLSSCVYLLHCPQSCLCLRIHTWYFQVFLMYEISLVGFHQPEKCHTFL